MDPLNLKPQMRVAYDKILAEKSVTHGMGVSLATVSALKDRGLIVLDFTGLNSRKRMTWIARPLGSGPLPKPPRKSNATAVSVSRLLGSSKDMNGDRIPKFRVERTEETFYEYSGFTARETGSVNRVVVKYVAAYGVSEAACTSDRLAAHKIYTAVLEENGYVVVANGGSLYVSRPSVKGVRDGK